MISYGQGNISGCKKYFIFIDGDQPPGMSAFILEINNLYKVDTSVEFYVNISSNNEIIAYNIVTDITNGLSCIPSFKVTVSDDKPESADTILFINLIELSLSGEIQTPDGCVIIFTADKKLRMMFQRFCEMKSIQFSFKEINFSERRIRRKQIQKKRKIEKATILNLLESKEPHQSKSSFDGIFISSNEIIKAKAEKPLSKTKKRKIERDAKMREIEELISSNNNFPDKSRFVGKINSWFKRHESCMVMPYPSFNSIARQLLLDLSRGNTIDFLAEIFDVNKWLENNKELSRDLWASRPKQKVAIEQITPLPLAVDGGA